MRHYYECSKISENSISLQFQICEVNWDIKLCSKLNYYGNVICFTQVKIPHIFFKPKCVVLYKSTKLHLFTLWKKKLKIKKTSDYASLLNHFAWSTSIISNYVKRDVEILLMLIDKMLTILVVAIINKVKLEGETSSS